MRYQISEVVGRMEECERLSRRIEVQTQDCPKTARRLAKVENLCEKAIGAKEVLEVMLDNKIKASEQILDNKLVILAHYDQHLSHLDKDV